MLLNTYLVLLAEFKSLHEIIARQKMHLLKLHTYVLLTKHVYTLWVAF